MQGVCPPPPEPPPEVPGTRAPLCLIPRNVSHSSRSEEAFCAARSVSGANKGKQPESRAVCDPRSVCDSYRETNLSCFVWLSEVEDSCHFPCYWCAYLTSTHVHTHTLTHTHTHTHTHTACEAVRNEVCCTLQLHGVDIHASFLISTGRWAPAPSH